MANWTCLVVYSLDLTRQASARNTRMFRLLFFSIIVIIGSAVAVPLQYQGTLTIRVPHVNRETDLKPPLYAGETQNDVVDSYKFRDRG